MQSRQASIHRGPRPGSRTRRVDMAGSPHDEQGRRVGDGVTRSRQPGVRIVSSGPGSRVAGSTPKWARVSSSVRLAMRRLEHVFEFWCKLET